MLALFGITGWVLWIWDFVVDPLGAKNTGILRGCIFALAMIPIATEKIHADRVIQAAVLFAMPLIGLVAFFCILLRLQGGMVYGIGGFMYFQLVGLVVLQGCPFSLAVVYQLVAGVLPNVLGLLIPDSSFEQSHYSALLWPAAALTVFVQMALHRQYERSYLLRQQLQEAAITDSLTGAFNRRHFAQVVDIETARSRRHRFRVSLLLIDIDRFKAINDRHGHAAGDVVLQTLSQMLKSHLRPSDRLFRWGGEEFVVLAPSTSLAEAVILAERLRSQCEATEIKPFGNVTLSIGVSEFAGETPIDWVKLADVALYNAKQNGRNRVEAATTGPHSIVNEWGQ